MISCRFSLIPDLKCERRVDMYQIGQARIEANKEATKTASKEQLCWNCDGYLIYVRAKAVANASPQSPSVPSWVCSFAV